VYARAGELLAAPFDLQRLELTGPPASILQGVSMHSTTGRAEFSASDNGTLAYVPGGSTASERGTAAAVLEPGRALLAWVDRKGVAQQLPAPARAYVNPRLSPDGQRLAVGISDTSDGVWVYDLARDSLTPIDATSLIPLPIWTPDGRSLTFNTTDRGTTDLFEIPADNSGTAERITTSEDMQFPGCWSRDGQVLAFTELDPVTGWDIWVLNRGGDGKPRPFLQTLANEGGPEVSPDGRWLAYQSDQSGRNEIYVSQFPGPGGKWPISNDGGTEAVWARNGRELFYRRGDAMMAVSVETKAGFVASKPKVLFNGNYEPGPYAFSANYDVSPDGQRFLMLKTGERPAAPAQVNIVLNWSDELRRLAPSGKP